MAIVLPDDEQDPMRIHLAELEYLVSDAEVERYNEMFNNDELRAQLAEKDKQYLEQEKKIKEMEEKFETREKQRKSQEKRIQARNKDIRELKQKIECNDFKLEADHDLIEKLRADKRVLQEKVDTLTEELQDYKRLLKENGWLYFEISRIQRSLLQRMIQQLHKELYKAFRVYNEIKNSMESFFMCHRRTCCG
jgi:chromosome segregation ATPase